MPATLISASHVRTYVCTYVLAAVPRGPSSQRDPQHTHAPDHPVPSQRDSPQGSTGSAYVCIRIHTYVRTYIVFCVFLIAHLPIDVQSVAKKRLSDHIHTHIRMYHFTCKQRHMHIMFLPSTTLKPPLKACSKRSGIVSSLAQG